MICDNCGAIIDENEEYCPNCGMQLLEMRPQKKEKPKKKKKNYNKSKSPGFEDSKPADKPIKQRYIENSQPESYDYSQYLDDGDDENEEYEQAPQEYNNQKQEKKSGIGIGNIFLFILLALILGFIVGLFMFSSPSIPQIPGINST